VRLVDIVLELQPEDCLVWWLTHPDVTVTGLDSRGVRVPVDRNIFGGRFAIDHENNSLRAGSYRWPSPKVCLSNDPPQDNSTAPSPALLLAPEPLPAPPDIPLQKLNGKDDSQAARCAADLQLIFPDGKWDGIYRLLAERIEQELGRSYSMDVVRAALGGKKP
jgi:hypothetical protein